MKRRQNRIRPVRLFRRILTSVLLVVNAALSVCALALPYLAFRVAFACVQLLGCLSALWIGTRTDMEGERRALWAAALLLSPLAAAPPLLAQRLRPVRRLRRTEESALDLSLHRFSASRLERSLPHWKTLCATLSGMGWPVFRNTATEWLTDSAALPDELDAGIRGAERFVFLECFRPEDSRGWKRMSALLRDKAQSGVEVALLCDSLRQPSAELLRASGVEVLFTSGGGSALADALSPVIRDRRSLAVIDGSLAYCGGVLPRGEAGERAARSLRLRGEGVWGVTASYLDLRAAMGGSADQDREYYRPHVELEEEGFCQSMADAPRRKSAIHASLLRLISLAQHSLTLSMPRFLPDEALIRALCIAAEGGVEVHLFLAATPEKKLISPAGEYCLGRLLQSGVRVFCCPPGAPYASCAVADGEAALVFTGVSGQFSAHYDSAVALYGCSAAYALLSELDQLHSRELTAEDYGARRWPRRVECACACALSLLRGV